MKDFTENVDAAVDIGNTLIEEGVYVMLPLESLTPLMRVTLIPVGQRAWLILLEAG